MAANKKLTKVIKGRQIKAVHQRGALLMLDFTDGSCMEIKLYEPTSSVMVRDKDKVLEYAD
jgi:hypothetical protein